MIPKIIGPTLETSPQNEIQIKEYCPYKIILNLFGIFSYFEGGGISGDLVNNEYVIKYILHFQIMLEL